MYKIVFLHYHLRSGGVTSVILRQLRAVEGMVYPFVVVGEEPQVDVNFPYAIISSVAYDRDRIDNLKPLEIANKILDISKNHFGELPDLVHVHNPILGKNRDFIDILNHLKDKGIPLLLQIHDFAEDGRPFNYQNRDYPEDVHYAVINRRDYNFLIEAGLKKDGLHLIPNIVEFPEADAITDPGFVLKRNGGGLVLYPVRAIRRKNIGEAILLSTFFMGDDYLGITLKPTSRIDMEKYKRWKEYVTNRRLKVTFELGINNPFQKLITESKFMVTTSIKEGFGMTFLEPWVFGKYLFGRLIPGVCDGFVENGLIFDSMYKSFKVPLDMVDREKLLKRLIACYLNSMKKYAVDVNRESMLKEFEELLEEGLVDFGVLDEEMQMEVINTILNSPAERKKIIDHNPKILNLSFSKYREMFDIIQHNREIIKREYSFEKIGNMIMEVYKRVISNPVKHKIKRDFLVKLFNRPKNTSLLLCENSYEKG